MSLIEIWKVDAESERWNRIYYLTVAVVIILSSAFYSGCSRQPPAPEQAEIVQLQNPETLISLEDNVLVRPTVMTLSDKGELLIYDNRLGLIKLFDPDGELLTELGEQGRGPGEYLRVAGLFSFDEALFLVDDIGFSIHEYRYDEGYSYDHINTFSFEPAGILQLPPLPPLPVPNLTFLENLFVAGSSSLPYLMAPDRFLIPSLLDGAGLYRLTEPDGSVQKEIGSLPGKLETEIDYENARNAVNRRELPAILELTSFPVSNRSNPDEIFLIYNAGAEISKIDLLKNMEHWKLNTSTLPEIDEIFQDYFNTSEIIQSYADAIVPLHVYTRGKVSQTGELFLSTYTTSELPMWIHKFSNNGELLTRYRLDTMKNLMPVFEVDTGRSRFLVITVEGEVLTFSYDNRDQIIME